MSLPLPLLYRGCLVGLGGNIPGSTPAPPAPIYDQTATARRALAVEGRPRPCPWRTRAWAGPARPLLSAVGFLLCLGFGGDVGWPMFCSLVGLISLLC
jgi:hypothetical protein